MDKHEAIRAIEHLLSIPDEEFRDILNSIPQNRVDELQKCLSKALAKTTRKEMPTFDPLEEMALSAAESAGYNLRSAGTKCFVEGYRAAIVAVDTRGDDMVGMSEREQWKQDSEMLAAAQAEVDRLREENMELKARTSCTLSLDPDARIRELEHYEEVLREQLATTQAKLREVREKVRECAKFGYPATKVSGDRLPGAYAGLVEQCDYVTDTAKAALALLDELTKERMDE